MHMKNRILITGSNSYIGSEIINCLILLLCLKIITSKNNTNKGYPITNIIILSSS